MKFLCLGLIPAAAALVACDTINAPLTSSTFDPLGPPRSSVQPTSASAAPEFTPGQFVTANIPNTAFYNNKPKANQDADKLLKVGTPMKIVSTTSSYVKVELDSGEVGYVPSVMVADVNAIPDVVPIDGNYQVYPPLPANSELEPLPLLDPNGLPPDGAIPAIIDPDVPFVPVDPPVLDTIPEMKDEVDEAPPATEEVEDPVAEAVRKKVEAAMAEENAT
ncbi:MAG: hypothetical protein ACSHX7_10990, partial [Luteolibacter sp.]